jgi:hypothetical protein
MGKSSASAANRSATPLVKRTIGIKRFPFDPDMVCLQVRIHYSNFLSEMQPVTIAFLHNRQFSVPPPLGRGEEGKNGWRFAPPSIFANPLKLSSVSIEML